MKQKILMLLVMVWMFFPFAMNAEDTIPRWIYICSQGKYIPKKISEISNIHMYRSHFGEKRQAFVDTMNHKTYYYDISDMDSVTFVGQGPIFSGDLVRIDELASRGYALEFAYELKHISAQVAIRKVRCVIDSDTTFSNAVIQEVETEKCLGDRQTIKVNLRRFYDEDSGPYEDYPYLKPYRPIYVYMEYCYEEDGVSSVMRTPAKALVIIHNIDKTIEFLCSLDCPHVKLSRKCRENE